MKTITRNDLAELMDKMHDEESATRVSAQKEYARDESNALANFDRIGAAVHCPHCGKPIGPFATLMVYLLKHVDGVLAHIGGNRTQREPVQGRIKDIRVYLALLRAMVERDEVERDEAVACPSVSSVGCPKCRDTGILKTGNNDLPCSCSAGDTATFNTGHGLMTGAALREALRGGGA